MGALKHIVLALFLLVVIQSSISHTRAQKAGDATQVVPKTWDDLAMATLEVPLANPIGSPKHVSAAYYYRIPVRPIYKSYPVYAPGHEPRGYVEWLKQQEPEIIWDDSSHRPQLKTETDWIKAGETVFDAPTIYGGLAGSEPTDLFVRDPQFMLDTGTPTAPDGSLPFFRYVVEKKGEVRIGALACGMCHTRIMPDGTILKGAQGSLPFDRVFAYDYTRSHSKTEDAWALERSLYAAPWVRPDGLPGTDGMSVKDIAEVHRAIPPGVLARHRSSPFSPVQVPDLIGVKDRQYLDRTGLQQQHSIVDLMRYAALNQGGDDLATFDGFIPADFQNFNKLPGVETQERYSDEQLYALAQYIYSLQPPPNPNKFDALAQQGQKVFQNENCGMCHRPPLYTNNKLTPANGFTIPKDHFDKYDIFPRSVGTDADLTLKTRRGTGYYKVPSLKGVWYRNMFGHNGWCATLEDWFEPRRTQDDYIPTGFKPFGAKSFAVKGHPYGLKLSEEDRKALIAFLKTL